MIRDVCISAVAVGMLAAANFASAQQAKPKRPDAAALFSQLDTNGDGVITKEEFKAGIAKLRAATGGAPAGGRPSVDDVLFRALDLNGDGKISAEELSRAAESLKKLDLNGDGFITRDELMAAAAAG